jgi:hypothetical protein
VTEVLVESQKTDFRLMVDAFKNKIVPHLLIAIMHVAGTLSNEHRVDQLLRSVAILVDKTDLEVEVSFHLFDAFAQHYRVDKANNARALILDKRGNIA